MTNLGIFRKNLKVILLWRKENLFILIKYTRTVLSDCSLCKKALTMGYIATDLDVDGDLKLNSVKFVK